MVVAYFEPGFGALGGALIGGAAGILLLLGGEILGASNLMSTILLYPKRALTDPGEVWRLFLVSVFMLISNFVLAHFFTDDERLRSDPSLHYVSTAGQLIAGFLVGFGTRLANGCTSGHGICGMARLNKRSFVAVGAFMLTALASVNLVAVDNVACAKYTAFLRTDIEYELHNLWIGAGVCAPFVLGCIFALYNLRKAYVQITIKDKVEASLRGDGRTERVEDEGDTEKGNVQAGATPAAQASESAAIDIEPKYTEDKKVPNRGERQKIMDGVNKLKPAFLAGILFSTGLGVSGMTLPSKILGFFNLFLISQETWDPTLVMVFGGGSIISFLSYQFVSGYGIIQWSHVMECPSRSSTFSIPKKGTIDFQLIFGSLCFGVGWGIGGLCPGPAIFLAASGCIPIFAFYWPAFTLGAWIAQAIKDRSS